MKKIIRNLIILWLSISLFSCDKKPSEHTVWDKGPVSVNEYIIRNHAQYSVEIEYYFGNTTVIRRNLGHSEYKDIFKISYDGYIIEGEEHYMLSDSLRLKFSDGRELWNYRGGDGFRGIYDPEKYEEMILSETEELVHVRYTLDIDEEFYELAVLPEGE